MGYRRTRRNRRTKSRKYRRQRGGDETSFMSFENKKEESNMFDGAINSVNETINDVTEWFNKPEWFPSSQGDQTAGKRRKRKHRRTYKK